jgi:EpsI family protein
LLIWLTGLPAYIDGDLVHVPAGAFEIAAGCSGLHFLIVGLALAALYGEMARDSLGRRVSWLLLMGALALVCNWLRIFTIVVAGYATDMRAFLVTVDHYWFGWLVFACGFAAFLWIAGRAVAGRSPPAPATSATAAFTGNRIVASYAATLVCLGVVPLTVYLADWTRGGILSDVGIDWPPAQPGWSGPITGRPTDWQPQFHNATASDSRAYVDPGGRLLEAFSAAYRTQQQGAKLVAYNNSVVGSDDGLRVMEERTVATSAGMWREARVTDPAGRDSIIRWHYQIGGRTFATPLASQLWYGLTSVASQPLSSLFAVRTLCAPDCRDARARLEASALRLQPTLHTTPAQRRESST